MQVINIVLYFGVLLSWVVVLLKIVYEYANQTPKTDQPKVS